MKICNNCKKLKPKNLFYKDNKTKDKLRHACKECMKICSNNWRINNPEKVKVINDNGYNRNRKNRIESVKKWRIKNPNKNKEYCKKMWDKNPEKYKEMSRKWGKLNKDKKIALNNKRRAKKLNATPKWLTKSQLAEIADFYKQAKELEAIFFNRKFHVDHIIPLQGKNVCGLHVPWNLQILTAQENMKKRNKVT